VEPDTPDLVQRAIQRDVDAFAHLYDRHLNAVYRFIWFRVREASLAEDLSAAVFAEAWQRIDRFEATDLPFHHWLLRIARNVVVEHWRSAHSQ
jgi:RNA polymerase sigma-70 factor (ECF subfamily)